MTLSLIYDRTLDDVNELLELAAVGWQNMTTAQKTAWLYGGGEPEILSATDGELTDSNAETITVIGGEAVVKGAYNYTDLNRVEGAVAYLLGYLQDLLDELDAYLENYNVAADPLFDMSYTVPTLVTKTNWAADEFFTGTDCERYLENVATLRDTVNIIGAPELPTTMNSFTYISANAIEQMLVMIEEQSAARLAAKKEIIDRTYPNFVYSAEIYCGEV